MLKSPIKREVAKGVAQVAGAAAAISNPAAALVVSAAAAALGVAMETLGYLGNKRTAELFDEELANQVVRKIHASDDFAGFLYSVWQKHNLESSKERRRYLKNFLSQEANKEKNFFENFSRIEYIIQNVSLKALSLLEVFHSQGIYGHKVEPGDPHNEFLNFEKLLMLLEGKGFKMPSADVEYFLNELVHYNLVAVLHGRFDGPLYNHTKLGFLILEYIGTEDNETTFDF